MLLGSCYLQHNSKKGSILDVKLPEILQSGKLEFSSMAWANPTQLFLVPQYPDRFENGIFSIKAEDISEAIAKGTLIQGSQKISMVNLNAVIKSIGETYEGFEATTIINGHVFFSIETSEKNRNCYLVGGKIEGNRIVLNPNKLMPLPKLKLLSNAGYESLAWLPAEKKLIAFFEYNKADVGSKAWLIDTSLIKQPETIAFNPLMFRLTDVASTSSNKLIGINYHYNGKKEFQEYIGADSNLVVPQLKGKTLRQSPYCRIIELTVANKTVKWSPVTDIPLQGENFEGIVPFKKGALIITDEYPSSVLKWVSF